MKRIFSLLMILFICLFSSFAQEEEESDDGFGDNIYIYESNGSGDQFLKIDIGGLFPLNFKNQLYTGGKASIGFFKFLNKSFALGGEFTATYNLSIGEKNLVMLPLTFGALYQPTYGKFEFPIYAEIGFSYETWQNIELFPSFAAKVSPGVYYRISESCSFGVSSDFFWIPQWFKDSSKNFNGLFESAAIGIRYHF